MNVDDQAVAIEAFYASHVEREIILKLFSAFRDLRFREKKKKKSHLQSYHKVMSPVEQHHHYDTYLQK